MLQVQNIEKYYGSKNNVTRALDRVSFDVEDGEFLAIMGASLSASLKHLCQYPEIQPLPSHAHSSSHCLLPP